MVTRTAYDRINIYLDDPDMKRQIKIAAANLGVSSSSYCVEAIRQQLAREALPGSSKSGEARQRVAVRLRRLRKEIGPVGIPVRDLIDEGRRR